MYNILLQPKRTVKVCVNAIAPSLLQQREESDLPPYRIKT